MIVYGSWIYKLAKTKVGKIIGFVGTMGIGAGLLIYGLFVDANQRKPGVDLNTADWSTLKWTQHVEFDLSFLMDSYMYTVKKGEVVSQSYVIPDLQINEEGRIYATQYLALEAKTSQEFNIYDRISENSYAWAIDETGTVEWAPEKEHLNGYLRLMNLKERKYMKEYLRGMGYSDAEIRELVVPYVVVTNTESVGRHIIFGAFVLVADIVSLFFMIRRSVNNGKGEIHVEGMNE